MLMRGPTELQSHRCLVSNARHTFPLFPISFKGCLLNCSSAKYNIDAPCSTSLSFALLFIARFGLPYKQPLPFNTTYPSWPASTPLQERSQRPPYVILHLLITHHLPPPTTHRPHLMPSLTHSQLNLGNLPPRKQSIAPAVSQSRLLVTTSRSLTLPGVPPHSDACQPQSVNRHSRGREIQLMMQTNPPGRRTVATMSTRSPM